MSILKRPLVTEKVSALNEKGKYGFIVDIDANKVDIKNAVEKMYNVNVERVNTLSVMGKKKVRYTKAGTLAGRKPNYKKAIVTLAEGEVIDFYSNV
ncbi:MAG: 50S ribosomal protein L23 [Bacteroidetes bacterium]|nr:50S ribosomal protein L23 [Bacteroidota bacterium]MBS1976545.1 50S ribosomal protein L23 [Bacteroidota bacterium]